MDRKMGMAELDRATVEEHRRAKKHPIIVVLEDIRSGHNVGSIFRTSDAFAIERIVLCGTTATPPHREIEKTALGATRSVNWKAEKDTASALHQLRNEGITLIAIEQTTKAEPLNELVNLQHPIALVFGNEVRGVSQETLALCKNTFMIPQFGTKHSFNVAVCAGIVLWQATGGLPPKP